MNGRAASPEPLDDRSSFLDGPFRVVVAMTVVFVVLVASVVVRTAFAPGPTVTPGPSALDPEAFLYAAARPAPEIQLTNQDDAPFTLASLRGTTTLVFFGYTHCPDVCPATMGIIGTVLAASGDSVRAVFVTVDPERDTVSSLHEYVRYLQTGVTAVTGTPTEIRRVADAWGVRYAKVAAEDGSAYSMSHTTDVYVVDSNGELRAHFPFGTQADAMLAGIRTVVTAAATAQPISTPTASATADPTAASPSPAPASAPVGDLRVEAISSSVWAGGKSPVIFRLRDRDGLIADTSSSVTVQLRASDGSAVGATVTARAVRPEGVDVVSYVAALDIPTPGWWTMTVTVASTTGARTGTGSLSALDPGTSARLGGSAPTARTPTLDDVGGRALAVTTDPAPDLRMSRTSTVDALAAAKPFVLVIDSVRFRVTPVCGKAVVLAKSLLDRWPDVTFIDLEPYAYSIVTDTAVIDGSLAAPSLVPAADAWGIGGAPWGAGSMPWVFVVDGHGIVRAKYQGVVGSDDVDVLLSLLVAGG